MTESVFKNNLDRLISKTLSNYLSGSSIKELMFDYYEHEILDTSCSKADFTFKFLSQFKLEQTLEFLRNVQQDIRIEKFGVEMFNKINKLMKNYNLPPFNIPYNFERDESSNNIVNNSQRTFKFHKEVCDELRSKKRTENFDKINELVKNIFPYIKNKFNLSIDTTLAKEKNWISYFFGKKGKLQLKGAGKSGQDKNNGLQLILLGIWDLIRNEVSHSSSKTLEINDKNATKYYELLSSIYYWIDECNLINKENGHDKK